ncbi:MAG: DUF1565 domain-containing protein [Pirellulaceae bacterium]
MPPTQSAGVGTSELYLVIANAESVAINGVRVTEQNLSVGQRRFLPETAIMVRNASPTILNNVIMNVRDGIVDDISSLRGPNSQRKDEVIVGNNVFQALRGVPSNVNPNDVFFDFNDVIPGGQQILENPAGDDFIPNAGSFVIDSSIDSLLERDRFASLKSALGLVA